MGIEEKLRIRAGEGYDVIIGHDLLKDSGEMIRGAMGARRCVIVSDSNVAPLYLEKTAASLEKSGLSAESFVFPAGEEHKTTDTFVKILGALADARLTRKDFVVALGGGVCGDMAGFAAGCYMRGIPFVQIPTTVLSMVDSSVGGKCAVDLPQGKNLAGVFHQPSLVICDIDTLGTLPGDIFADGMAEVVKTAILTGGELFDLLMDEKTGPRLWKIISLCVAYKGGVVERDEKEQGERRLLNLGHTPGHAIEKCSGYTVSHGKAVAIGTAMMARASDRLGRSEAPLRVPAEKMLRRYGLPVTTSYTPEELLNAALLDKKRSGKTTSVIIPEAVGRCVIENVTDGQLLEIFRAGWEADPWM